MLYIKKSSSENIMCYNMRYQPIENFSKNQKIGISEQKSTIFNSIPPRGFLNQN